MVVWANVSESRCRTNRTIVKIERINALEFLTYSFDPPFKQMLPRGSYVIQLFFVYVSVASCNNNKAPLENYDGSSGIVDILLY